MKKKTLFLLLFIIANIFSAIYLYLNKDFSTADFIKNSATILLAFTAACFPIITIISLDDNELNS